MKKDKPTKDSYIGSIFLFVVFLLIAFAVLLLVLSSKTQIEEYYSSIDLKFEGVVYEKSSADHSRGILHLNLIKSSVEEYDVRDSEDIYLCVIKDGKADLITSGLFRVEIGDTIRVDAAKRRVALIRNKEVVSHWKTYMSNTLGGFHFYRKLHKL